MNKTKKIKKIEKEFISIGLKRAALSTRISELQSEYESTNNRYYYLKGVLQEYKEQEECGDNQDYDKQKEDVSN